MRQPPDSSASQFRLHRRHCAPAERSALLVSAEHRHNPHHRCRRHGVIHRLLLFIVCPFHSFLFSILSGADYSSRSPPRGQGKELKHSLTR